MAVTLDDLDKLDPGSNQDVQIALAFLRLVVTNNPQKTAADLLVRPDVQSALSTLNSWFTAVETLAHPAFVQSPLVPDVSPMADLLKTVARMRAETAFNDRNVEYWKSQEPYQEQGWIASLLLRMGWLVRFLSALLGVGVPENAITKTWNCRLAPNSCSYCTRLHGTTILVADSFLPYADAAGWTKPYGGLYGPPLHPNCQCWLTFV